MRKLEFLNVMTKDVTVPQVIHTHLKMLIKHSIWRHIFLAIVLIFFILSFVPNGVENTPVKVELVKLSSETVCESINNISGSLSIKNWRQKNIWERVVKIPLKSFFYFRCGDLKLTCVEVTEEISWKNTKQNEIWK